MSKAETSFERGAKALYDRLKSQREPYVKRAQNNAKVTIPSLFPDTGTNSSTDFVTPQQSLGARGLNNLASKIMLTLMPNNVPFFRLDVNDDLKQQSEEQNTPELLTAIQYELAKLERKAMKFMAEQQFRPTLSEVAKQLICAGNAAIYLPPAEGGIKMYRLTSYVCQRDGLGNMVQLVALDNFSFATLPDDLKSAATKAGPRKPDDKIEVYTHVYLEGDQFISYVEVDGEEVSGYEQTYPKEACPWIAIRLYKMEGEDYGRSYVEEYIGDLNSVEALSKAIIGYAAVASRIIHLVSPNGQTRVKAVAEAKTGDFVSGKREDITTLNLEKSQDFQTARAVLADLKSDLAFAFLLNNAVQRQAERVTAEEIRYVAQELEETLGGIYSLLGQELQLPLVRRVLIQMEHAGLMAKLPPNAVTPAITTGVEALGRGQDLNNVDRFLGYLTNVPGAVDYVKVGGLLQTVATALNIDVGGLIKSDQEVMAQQQQAQAAELGQTVAPEIAKGMVANGGQQPPQQQ